MKTLKTKEELNEWKKTVKEVYTDSTHDYEGDITVVHGIYEDSEGNVFQVDWYYQGWGRISPINKDGFNIIPVKKVVSYHKVTLTKYEAIEGTPYETVIEEDWEDTYE